MHRFLGLLLFISICSAQAGVDALIGGWEGGDTASMSTYGTVRISRKNILWGGHDKYHPKCQASYLVIPEDGDIAFKDQVGSIFSIHEGVRLVQQRRFEPGGNATISEEKRNFSTYLLKIEGGKCLAGTTHLRLTFPFENDFTYLDMIEFEKLDQPVGWMHFHKKHE